MSSAISAAQNDASIILVEKQAYLGGSYYAPSGNMAVAEIEENKDSYFQESNDTLTNAIQRFEARIEDTKVSDSYDCKRVEII